MGRLIILFLFSFSCCRKTVPLVPLILLWSFSIAPGSRKLVTSLKVVLTTGRARPPVFLGFFVRFNSVFIFRIFRNGWNWGCTCLFSIPLKLWSGEIQLLIFEYLTVAESLQLCLYYEAELSPKFLTRNYKSGTIKKITQLELVNAVEEVWWLAASMVLEMTFLCWKWFCEELWTSFCFTFNLLQVIIDDSSSLDESKRPFR